MTWRSFIDYVLMREFGQEDAIVRNYDLDNLNGSKPGLMLDRAALRMGLDQPNIARPLLLPMIQQMMRNVGYAPPPTGELHVIICQWYIWDRIRKGEVRQWPLKSRENPLFN